MNYRLASSSFFRSINLIGIFLIFAEDNKWLQFPYNPWAAGGKYQLHILGLVQRTQLLQHILHFFLYTANMKPKS